jgi:very-short-patch-repair endonuclease
VIARKRPLRPRNTLEARLWARLRELEGYRFRRKCPFKTFTLDFVEHDRRLVIVFLEGAPGKAQPVHIVRDRLLNEQGYVILRLWREEVDRDLSGAVHTIKLVLADLSDADSG